MLWEGGGARTRYQLVSWVFVNEGKASTVYKLCEISFVEIVFIFQKNMQIKYLRTGVGGGGGLVGSCPSPPHPMKFKHGIFNIYSMCVVIIIIQKITCNHEFLMKKLPVCKCKQQ